MGLCFSRPGLFNEGVHQLPVDGRRIDNLTGTWRLWVLLTGHCVWEKFTLYCVMSKNGSLFSSTERTYSRLLGMVMPRPCKCHTWPSLLYKQDTTCSAESRGAGESQNKNEIICLQLACTLWGKWNLWLFKGLYLRASTTEQICAKKRRKKPPHTPQINQTPYLASCRQNNCWSDNVSHFNPLSWHRVDWQRKVMLSPPQFPDFIKHSIKSSEHREEF